MGNLEHSKRDQRQLALTTLLCASLATSQAATLTVTTTADAGAGSLRQAIVEANGLSGPDLIDFAIPGAGPHTITPDTPLPTITDAVSLDGSTQAGSDCSTWPPVLRIVIDGSGLGGVADGLVIRGDDVLLKGLAVAGAPGDGIDARSSDRTVVTCSFIGTDISGSAARPNGRVGILVSSSSEPTIGRIEGSVGNLISGNGLEGIALEQTNDARVAGNHVGSDSSGNSAIGNTVFGVNLQGSRRAMIEGNVIVANGGAGILLEGEDASDNTIVGNHVGIGADGSTALPNVAFSGPTGGGAGVGIWVLDGADNRIGGTASVDRNVISSNAFDGITIANGATRTTIQGNFIGTDATGLLPRGNGFSGIAVFSGVNTIGGPEANAGNVLADNGVFGIGIDGADDNLVQGNAVGVGADGATMLGNRGTTIGGTGQGIFLEDVSGTQVKDNVVGANASDGILLQGVSVANSVQGNFVGTNRAGTLRLGNARDGIDANGDSRGNTIGGLAIEDGNTVAFNGDAGIELDGIDNQALGNHTFENAGIGIDLGGDGLDIDDAGDGDAGPNNRQNSAELLEAVGDGSMLALRYRVDSGPGNSAYPLRVEFFLADVDGEEGAQFIGAAAYDVTDAQEEVTAEILTEIAIFDGDRIVATVTDGLGNTSEFSSLVVVDSVARPDLVFFSGFESTTVGQKNRTAVEGN